MTITLNLSKELERKVRKQAERAGLDAIGYVQHLIEIAPEDSEAAGELTPAETVACWLRDPFPIFECLPDSRELARDLRRQAETR